jgi:hypothetical protein
VENSVRGAGRDVEFFNLPQCLRTLQKVIKITPNFQRLLLVSRKVGDPVSWIQKIRSPSKIIEIVPLIARKHENSF